jgi:hypothetical protein
LHGMYVLTQFTGIMEALMLGLLVAVPWSWWFLTSCCSTLELMILNELLQHLGRSVSWWAVSVPAKHDLIPLSFQDALTTQRALILPRSNGNR